LELRHPLPTVELNKSDIRWLWDELTKPFHEPPPGMETSSVQGTISAGTNGDAIEEVGIDEFLGSGLSDILDSLTISIHGDYRKPKTEFGYLGDSRRVYLHLSAIGANEVTIKGEKDWIQRVRGFLDGFFEKRRRNVRGLRWATTSVFALAPAIAFYSVGRRIGSDAIEVGAIFWTFLGFYFFLLKAEEWHPANLLVIDERGLRRPWYVMWTRELLAGVLIGAVTAVVLTIGWPS